MKFLVAVNTCIFLFLSCIHIYWACGGKQGLEGSIPVMENGHLVFHPHKLATVIIGLGLLVFAFATIGNTGIFDKLISTKYFRFAMWLIGAIFFVRVIGDFRYFGLTKEIKDTKFAIRDSKIYTPLCLVISMISIAIPLLQKKSTSKLVD